MKEQVLVTGGSRGIGLAIVETLLKTNKYKIIATFTSNIDSNYQSTQIREDHADLEWYDVDFNDNESLTNFLDLFKSELWFDHIVHNSGICPFEKFEKIKQDDLMRTFNINFFAPFLISQAFVNNLTNARSDNSSICFISSISADLGGELQAHYCASKGAVDQLMRSLAISLGNSGIRSNSVQPGTVLTDINREIFNLDQTSLDIMERKTCLGRLNTAKEIANAVRFLISDEAKGITGATLRVDAGISINLQ